MAVSKIAICTGDNVRVRSSASTSSNNVVVSIDEGQIVFTNGSTSSGSGYTWYYIYLTKNDINYKGYSVNSYYDIITESINFSTNYSSGKSITFTWSSTYSSYIDVDFTLTDNFGNTFFSNSSRTSFTIDNLNEYYVHGDQPTFTLTASYEEGYNFSKNDEERNLNVDISLGSFSQNPVITSISQNNDGTFNLNWNAAAWNGSSSLLWYYITSNPSGPGDFLGNTSNTYLNNIAIPAYGNVTIFVTAKEENTDIWSDSDFKSTTFYKPSLSAPKISISSSSGSSTVITKTDNAVLSYGIGTIDYELHRGSTNNSERIDTFSNDTYTITESQLNNWGITNQSFFVKAIATITKPTGVVANNSLNENSNLVNFIYEPHKTILYYTGNGLINGYEECIVYYYTGNPNEGDNGWVECEPYIYTGESNATISGWQICSYT